MNNNVEYQLLYQKIILINNKIKDINSNSNILLNTLEKGVNIDDRIYKEEDIKNILSSNQKIKNELEEVIVPIIKQNLV